MGRRLLGFVVFGLWAKLFNYETLSSLFAFAALLIGFRHFCSVRLSHSGDKLRIVEGVYQKKWCCDYFAARDYYRIWIISDDDSDDCGRGCSRFNCLRHNRGFCNVVGAQLYEK